MQGLLILLPPAYEVGQGNIFTGVCHSVHRGDLPSHNVIGQADHPQEADPPQKANDQQVRILLECILVLYNIKNL